MLCDDFGPGASNSIHLVTGEIRAYDSHSMGLPPRHERLNGKKAVRSTPRP